MCPRALLLTGRPGVGKTTLLRQALAQARIPAGGFYTQEVRAGSVRIGFDLVTLDGQQVPLARAGLASPYRVGRYGVDREALERVGVMAVRRALATATVVVVDEIGRMELCSPAFIQVVEDALAQGAPLLGTVMQKPHPFADRVKSAPGVRVLEVLPTNREEVRAEALRWLESLPLARPVQEQAITA
ncbi:Nucleoside-triphosphatase THEP1 [bacterium HR23]|nr:Nucleoside-triphosphatase THEP1 [bacterium HR23]